ncbi:hypothetical protein BZA77DRAFT_18100 [Pyronema omphalodes]|nr:hypothetical protein BZA77DRAFT_18100 [Pyronema omphalodes]
MPQVSKRRKQQLRNIALANAAKLKLRRQRQRQGLPDSESLDDTELVAGAEGVTERIGEGTATQEGADLRVDAGLDEGRRVSGGEAGVDSAVEGDLELDANVIDESKDTSGLSLELGSETSWKSAESKLLGNSRLMHSQTPGARWARKNFVQMKKKKQEEEAADLQKKYGNITRFFTSAAPYQQRPSGL